MSVLGIDFGSRRIGLAISDPEERIAFPAGTLESHGRKADVAAIRSLAEERGVRRVVVGLPLHMDGRAGTGAEAARAFAEALAKELALPVETLDERWTTREAERTLRETGGSGLGRRAGTGRREKRGATDTLAATLLLRTFLDRQHQSGGGGS
jgi:putative Holliday junction resolvase